MTSNVLDNTSTKVQNMACKTSQMDQIALEYLYYGFLWRLRVDGRGFLHQTPILKNCPPEGNQVAAHAQKRVTVPLRPRHTSVWQYLPACNDAFTPYGLASHGDVLRGSSRVPVPQKSAESSGKKRRPITAHFQIWEVHFGT